MRAGKMKADNRAHNYNKSSVLICIEQRHHRARRRRFINITAFICMVSVIAALSGVIVKANDKVSSHLTADKYYTSISIERNDTLWGLAQQYAPEEADINAYVKDIKAINRLSGDNITQGQNLIVYYYK